MQRTHKIIGLLTLFFLIAPAFASAAINTTDIVAAFSFVNSTDFSDASGNRPSDLTNYGSTSADGILTKARNLTSDYVADEDVDQSDYDFGSGAWAISFWVKYDTDPGTTAATLLSTMSTSSATGQGIITKGTSGEFTYYSSHQVPGGYLDSGVNPTTNIWYHIVVQGDGYPGSSYIYVNGVHKANTSVSDAIANNDDLWIGKNKYSGFGQPSGVIIDNIVIKKGSMFTTSEISELYNSGSGLEWDFSGTSAGVASEILQRDSYLEQSGSTTINSVNYVSVLSGSVTFDNATWIYGSATVPLVNPLASNQADCRISINGSELNQSEASRTLTAGQNGNLKIMSFQEYVTAGSYAFSLDCKRTGGGAYTVENSSLYLHILSNEAGEPVNTAQYNITSDAISGLIDTFSITTTGNDTDTGYDRVLVLEWSAQFDYTSTQNMSLNLEVAGTNCTPVNRYGSSGSLGSVAGVCLASGVSNSTSYDVNIYGSGSGNLENAVFQLKEFVLHTNEANYTEFVDVLINSSSPTVIATHNLVIDAGHSTPHIADMAVISFYSNNGTAEGVFYLNDDDENSSAVSRTVGAGQPGVVGLQINYENESSGTDTFNLYGSCDNANCTATIMLLSYITSDLPITPNSFFIFVNNTYTGSLAQEFGVIVENTTYQTTSGSIEVFCSGCLANVTFPANNDTNPPFFPNNTLNHDSSSNLTIQAIPWTSVYALEPDSSTVYNFTINYTNINDTSEKGSWTTTSGVAYVPLTNATYNLTITGAVGNDSTNFAIQTQTVNVSTYLENYTFNLLVANSVNITFYDEETGNIINDREIVLEYYSDTGTSGNDTTSSGVMFVNLLLPEQYTFVYDAPGYDQRFYEYILVNETFNNINLTLLNSSSSSTVTITVKDTLDNLLENAVVKILKFDLANNEDDLLEVRRTNFEGQTIAGMILNDPLYRFIIEYDGDTVLTTSRTQIYGTDLTLVVNLIQATGYEEIFAGYLMSGSVEFDNSTNLFTFTFNDESNTGQSACLRVYRVGSSRTNYNATCTTTTSGSLSLSVENVSGRSYQAFGYITDSSGYTHTIDSAWAVFTERISDDGSSLLMMILMIIIFATALAVSVEIALVTSFAVPVIFTATGLTSLSYGVTIPLLLIGVILAFVLGVIKK